jgi:Fe-S cluster biogenesis protein NfuA
VKERVQAVLDQVRPFLQADGGDVQLVDADPTTGIVKLHLQGACSHCTSSLYTVQMGIETRLKEAVPEVREVVTV